jgi:hypothetical protein
MPRTLSRRQIVIVAAALLTVWLTATAGAAITGDTTTRLTDAFDALEQGPDLDAAGEVTRVIADTEGSSENDWQTFFHMRFQTHAFTGSLMEFWDHVVHQAGAEAERPAGISAVCAAEAASTGLGRLADNGPTVTPDAILVPLVWLEQVSPLLKPDTRRAVFGTLSEPLKGKPLDLVGILRPGPDAPPGLNRMGMQIGLTFNDYAGREPAGRSAVGEYLRLPNWMRTFWEPTGILVFDNGALTPAQLTSLESLVRHIPPELHLITALIVPEATGIDPARPGIVTAGQLVYISAIPLERLTNPEEFIRHTGQPIAPEFTVMAAQQILRAVQTVQFTRRPWLVGRRDTILARARDHRERYLRRFVPPAAYLDRPDELLPQTGYLWFIDSVAAFWMALDYARLREREAMEAVLLLADVLSNGGNTTLLFATDPAGQVTSMETPITRLHMEAPGIRVDHVNGIKVLDTLWAFQLNPAGAVVGLLGKEQEPPL